MGHSARHCMKRAAGLVMRACLGSFSGSDQAFQVLSGRAEFPVRVRNKILSPPPCHCKCPQRATLMESCTSDSYEAGALPGAPKATSRAGLLIAANSPSFDLKKRVVSPLPGSEMSV